MDAMWAEIEALQQQLAAAQEEDTSQRLSDRNCIEIIMKLKEMNLVELIHSSNGKFYLTPQKLRSEVFDALVNAGGRSTIGDLADEVGVNYDHVEEALAAIKEEKKLIFYLGNFITQEYLDFIAGEVFAMTNVSGFVSIAKVSQEFDLSGEFLIEHVPSRCAAMINNQKTGFYTEAYIRRTSVTVRAYLSAATKPLHMKHFYAKYKFTDETIVDKIVDDLIKTKRIKGKYLNRGHIACFFPSIYLEEQTKAIKMKIESYGYIKLDELKHGIDTTSDKEANRWMKENFPDFIKTDTHFMSLGFIERTKTELEQNIQQTHLVDLFSIFPEAFSEKDVEYVLRSASSSSSLINDAKIFGSSWMMDDQALEECAAMFYPAVDERAEKAASKKIVTIITEDDFVKVDKKSPSVTKAEVSSGKEKGGAAGGRGAREVKTKGKNKKQKKKEAQESIVQKKEGDTGALTEDEIKEFLQKEEKYEIMEEEALQDLIDIISPKLAERYQIQATNIFTSKQQAQNDAKGQRKKTRKEQEEYINNCFCKLQLFEKGLVHLFKEVDEGATDQTGPTQLSRYLFKTVGMDLVNAVFALSSDSQETTLTPAMRQKILKSVEDADRVDPAAFESLKALNDAKTVDEILAKVADACDYGAGMMIKAGNKRQETVKKAHIEDMRKALETAPDLPTTLHLAVSLMHAQSSAFLIHFSGKFVPLITEQMAALLQKEQVEVINEAQEIVVKNLRGEEIDTTPFIEKLKSFDYTTDAN